MMEFTLKTDEGAYDLEANVRLIGNDLLVAIWGGEKPHIGAVSVAQARPSLKDPNVTSATASVFCFVGHKEDELAKAASEILAAAMNTQVVVTAGIHWDNMSKEGIQKVIRNSEILVDLILEKIASSYP
jgi:predicted nucleotide-binding protein